jgi:hypothetical protein
MRVVVEAKIGHVLTVDQIAGYADRLRGDAGLLVVLVPEGRRLEGEQVIREYRDRHPDGRVRVDVWTFDEVTSSSVLVRTSASRRSCRHPGRPPA